MRVIGLTGGLGSGKSTVARMLADRGAVVLDADVIAREVVEPSTEGYREVVEAFGDGVVAPDGSLDRQALAREVFGDPSRRRVLEGIIHPRVGMRIAERLSELSSTDAVVVLDIPLLAESKSGTASAAERIVVVTAPEETRVRRAVDRGMDPEDARARIAAQAGDGERRAIADHEIRNDGTLEELEQQVDALWRELTGAGA